jgi:hypothetical protein
MAQKKVIELRHMQLPDYLKGAQLRGHVRAVNGGWLDGNAGRHESALVKLADAIAAYATAMLTEMPDGDALAVESGIGPMLDGWRWLLNHERGRLDGGVCDAWAQHMTEVLGYEKEEEGPRTIPGGAAFRPGDAFSV